MDHTTATTRLPARRLWDRIRYPLVLIVAVSGLSLALFLFFESRSEAAEKAETAFLNEATLAEVSAQERFANLVSAVQSVRWLFVASQNVNNSEFQLFIEGVFETTPPVTQISWIPRVTRDERLAFESAARIELGPAFTIVDAPGAAAPSASRSHYLPVLYSGASTSPVSNLGVDLSQDNAIAAAMARAIHIGAPVAAPGRAATPGAEVLLVIPHYPNNAPIATETQRDASLVGFVIAAFSPAEVIMLEAADLVTAGFTDRITLTVTDVTESGEPDTVLYAAKSSPLRSSSLSASAIISVADQTWIITARPTSAFYTTFDALRPWILLALELSVTALIVGYLLLLQRRSNQADALVARRTRELRQANIQLQTEIGERALAESSARADEARLQSVLDTTVDGIITIDKRAHIQSFNQAAEAIFGYRSDEVTGENISMLMPDPDRSSHETYMDNYERTSDPQIIGVGREVEGLREDGTIFPLELFHQRDPRRRGHALHGHRPGHHASCAQRDQASRQRVPLPNPRRSLTHRHRHPRR
jgi:PAS domain S-box-containing protein